jgi:hypothetical protein
MKTRRVAGLVLAFFSAPRLPPLSAKKIPANLLVEFAIRIRLISYQAHQSKQARFASEGEFAMISNHPGSNELFVSPHERALPSVPLPPPH